MMLAVARPASVLDRGVTAYMAPAVYLAAQHTPIAEIAAMLDAQRISAVPIVDHAHHPLGIVTRTDLIALGASQSGCRPTSEAMPLPRRRADEVMSQPVISVPATATVRDAARAMALHGIHRVLVVERGILVGVCSASNIASAVRDSHAGAELSAVMSTPLVTVTQRTPLGAAVELLDKLRLSTLVVLDEDRPVGLFTQLTALAARDLPRATPIEDLHDSLVVCLSATTPLWIAAGQIASLEARRVIVCSKGEPIGLVTALDLVRWVAW